MDYTVLFFHALSSLVVNFFCLFAQFYSARAHTGTERIQHVEKQKKVREEAMILKLRVAVLDEPIYPVLSGVMLSRVTTVQAIM